MSRDRVPKNSVSIAMIVFKKLPVKTRDDYVITPSEPANSNTMDNTVKMEPISFRKKVYKDCKKPITFKQLPFPIFQSNNELNIYINWWFVTELLNLHL